MFVSYCLVYDMVTVKITFLFLSYYKIPLNKELLNKDFRPLQALYLRSQAHSTWFYITAVVNIIFFLDYMSSKKISAKEINNDNHEKSRRFFNHIFGFMRAPTLLAICMIFNLRAQFQSLVFYHWKFPVYICCTLRGAMPTKYTSSNRLNDNISKPEETSNKKKNSKKLQVIIY